MYDTALSGTNVMVQNRGMRVFARNQLVNRSDNPDYIPTKNHVDRAIYTYSVDKVGLTQKYPKRIVLADGVTTVPLRI